MFIDFRERGRREEERQRNRARERDQLVASCTHPNGGQNPQPQNVPRPGVETSAFWCRGGCFHQPNHMARATYAFLKK